jgi:hypothetical protein
VEARFANLGTGQVSNLKAGKTKKKHYESPEIANLGKTLHEKQEENPKNKA